MPPLRSTDVGSPRRCVGRRGRSVTVAITMRRSPGAAVVVKCAEAATAKSSAEATADRLRGAYSGCLPGRYAVVGPQLSLLSDPSRTEAGRVHHPRPGHRVRAGGLVAGVYAMAQAETKTKAVSKATVFVILSSHAFNAISKDHSGGGTP